MKGNGGGEIVHEPAEAAVVEIDQRHAIGVDEQIGEPHIGMNQAKSTRRRAISRKIGTPGAVEPREYRRYAPIDMRRLAPVAPELVGVEDRRVPARADKACGRTEFLGVPVGGRGIAAERLEQAGQIVGRRRLPSRFGGEQHGVARRRPGCRKTLDDLAVAPGEGFGEHGEGFVRLALVENEQRIRQAARNLRRFFDSADQLHNVVPLAARG